MDLITGACALGLAYAFLSLGVFITFRIFRFPDITVDGSFTLGAALFAVLAAGGVHPAAALAVAVAGGMAAGTLTGLVNTRLGAGPLLSGILVMTALYSVNLRIMGRPNIPLLHRFDGSELPGDAAFLAEEARDVALRPEGEVAPQLVAGDLGSRPQQRHGEGTGADA